MLAVVCWFNFTRYNWVDDDRLKEGCSTEDGMRNDLAAQRKTRGACEQGVELELHGAFPVT